MKRILDRLRSNDLAYSRTFGAILLGVLIIMWYLSIPANNTIQNTPSPTPILGFEHTPTPEPCIVTIYLVGEIANPGVYEVPSGSLVNYVVKMAGGFTENANPMSVNLAYELKENCMIIISSINEEIAEPFVSSKVLYPLEDTAKPKLININKASLTDLCTLPGIGEATAKRIIQYREKTSFANIEDIMNVSGIGQSKFDAIKDLITVE